MSAASRFWPPAVFLQGLDRLSVPQVLSASIERRMEADAATKSPLSDGSLHSTLGALLVGTWTNYMLLALEFIYIWRYFVLFPRRQDDALWIRVLVLSMLVIDIATTADMSFLVYWQAVVSWGTIPSFAHQSELARIYGALTAASAFLMQGFLLHRYTRLSQNFVLAFFIALCAITAVIGNALAMVMSAKYSSTADWEAANTYISIWLVASLLTDVCIAAALAREFSHVNPIHQTTKSLLHRLIRNAILSGSVTAFLAAAMLICSLVFSKHYNYSTMIGFNLGRACTLTVVYNLNFRHTGRNIVSMSDTSNANSFNLRTISFGDPEQGSGLTHTVSGAQDLSSTNSTSAESGAVSTHDRARHGALSTMCSSHKDHQVFVYEAYSEETAVPVS